MGLNIRGKYPDSNERQEVGHPGVDPRCTLSLSGKGRIPCPSQLEEIGGVLVRPTKFELDLGT